MTLWVGREPNRSRKVLPAALVCFVLSIGAVADPLHAVGDGAFMHHDSSWIFPNEIAGFVRVGAPQDIDGSSDAAAYYSRVVNGVRTTASVDIYPRDSAAATAKLADAKVAIELKSASAAQVWTENPFSVGKQRRMVGVEWVHASGGTQTHLYFIDTGPWIVKIRAMAPESELDTLEQLDVFVREQQWESLGLSEQTCTGPACEPSRPAPTVPSK